MAASFAACIAFSSFGSLGSELVLAELLVLAEILGEGSTSTGGGRGTVTCRCCRPPERCCLSEATELAAAFVAVAMRHGGDMSRSTRASSMAALSTELSSQRDRGESFVSSIDMAAAGAAARRDAWSSLLAARRLARDGERVGAEVVSGEPVRRPMSSIGPSATEAFRGSAVVIMKLEWKSSKSQLQEAESLLIIPATATSRGDNIHSKE